jgi:L-amino acid N-acyltransferase YncA
MDCIIEIARDKDLETLYALILPDNQSAIKLFQEKGFTVDFSSTNEVVKATLALKKTEG